ncbi:MAG: rhomboid family intramembrane serine protease [Bacteroidales bacterium]|jgi:membrane associated rhomboid family serine protease|nr:rhomboid family intramembrane serine protease [Bacteroidales bacterium]
MNNGQIGIGGFNILPKGIKNLLIINILLFFATYVFAKANICDLNQWLGLHYFKAPDFHVWQFITYMFMHANFGHIFFNMFALWMFGAVVENTWGTRKFLIYYLITGIGAALTHYIITFVEIGPTLALFNQFLDAPSLETYRYLVENNTIEPLQSALQNNYGVLQRNPDSLNELVAATMTLQDNYLNSFTLIGASGAVYGVLLAFGWLFPNSTIYIYFLVPIKAKWLVLFYGIIEMVYGVTGTSDGVAHFAHLGGMVFGILLIWMWTRNDRQNSQQTYYHISDNRDNNRREWKWPFQKRDRETSGKSKYYVSHESGRPLSDEEFNARKQEEKKRIDTILDKISKSGYGSLTAEEKEILFRQSQK